MDEDARGQIRGDPDPDSDGPPLRLVREGEPSTEVLFRVQIPEQQALTFEAALGAFAVSLASLLQPGGALPESDVGVPLPAAGLSPITLSRTDQDEVLAYGFKSTASIFIGGESASRGGGVVHVGGRPVSLPPRLFRLFLRLVVALHESGSGYVDRGTLEGGGLSDEGYYEPQNLDRILAELRNRFGGVVSDARGPVSPLQFVEVDGGQLRLSTHRSCVTYAQTALLEHPDEGVQQLAARLPEPDA